MPEPSIVTSSVDASSARSAVTESNPRAATTTLRSVRSESSRTTSPSSFVMAASTALPSASMTATKAPPSGAPSASTTLIVTSAACTGPAGITSATEPAASAPARSVLMERWLVRTMTPGVRRRSHDGSAHTCVGINRHRVCLLHRHHVNFVNPDARNRLTRPS